MINHDVWVAVEARLYLYYHLLEDIENHSFFSLQIEPLTLLLEVDLKVHIEHGCQT